MRHTLFAPLGKSLRNLAMLSAACIMLAAPLVSASIGQDELKDFVKWPLYQNCGDPLSTPVASAATPGLTISGSSDFITGDPLTLRYPQITDEAKFAAAMEAFIKRTSPNSPWSKISNIGARLAAEGKTKNVNPMMIIVIGRHETNYGGDGGGSARSNNSFGNKGSGPNGYRVWPSVEDSLFGSDNFIGLVSDRIEHRDSAPRNYDKVTNMYEYLSVHISGQIIYPGDNTAVHDELMNVSVTVTNVMRYFTYAKTWIGEMTGLKIDGTPVRGAGAVSPGAAVGAAGDVSACILAAVAAQGGSGAGAVNPDGYSFPVADQTQRSYGGSGPICNSKPGCHHGGGVPGANPQAAMDLMYGTGATMGGKAVYAISDGSFTFKQYRVPKCFALHFRSSKDGFDYWYGHLQNVNEGLAGQPVKAGTKIAEVAGLQFDEPCFGRAYGAGKAPHLHIDRGCEGTTGGGSTCRDPKFIDLMNNIWRGLPKTGGPEAV